MPSRTHPSTTARGQPRLAGRRARRQLQDPLKGTRAQLLLYARDLQRLLQAERRKSRELEATHQQLQKYATDLQKTYQAEKARTRELYAAYLETIHRLTIAAEYKDEETAHHIRRISHYAKVLALELGWSEPEADLLFEAAPMHDVGKIGVPDAILFKPGPLTPEEWAVMQTHPVIGERILAGSSSPLLKLAAEIAGGHHERWDGSGYPRWVRGEAIPMGARIVMLVDQYDALRSQRPYKPAFDHEKTCEILLHGDGRTLPAHFQSEMLEAFQRVAGQFAEIFGEYADA